MRTSILRALGVSSLLLLLAACGSSTTVDAPGTAVVDASTDAPTLDAAATATPDAATPDSGPTNCTGCAPGQICVAHRTFGGAAMLPSEAGACPPGTHVEEMGGATVCEDNWIYTCGPAPAGCSGAINCACASNYCADHSFGEDCSIRTATASDIECTLALP